MTRDYLLLDVLKIYTLIKPLLRAEVAISIAAIQVAVAQIRESYSPTCRKTWLTKQKAVALDDVIQRGHLHT